MPASKRYKKTKPRRPKNASSMLTFSSMSPGVDGGRYVQKQTAVCPFPLRYDVALTYGVNVALGTVGGIPTASVQSFRLNSLYDPDFTGTGGQPYQFDQLTGIYRQYIVEECYVELTITDPSVDGLWVGYSFHTSTTSNDAATGKTLDDLMSRPTFRCLPLNNTGQQFVTIKERIPVHTVLGLTKTQYMAVTDQYGAAYNANPLTVAFLSLFIIDPNSTVTAQYVRFAGRLVYKSQLFDYAAPAAS